MRIDKQKEKEFMDSKFDFSYSSINRLLFSPKIFYKEYILKEKEIKTDSHLVEGRVIHTLLLQPNDFDNIFTVLPNKIPSEATRNVLNELKKYNNSDIFKLNNEILKALENQNLYQSFKDDAKKLSKIQTPENIEYFKFLFIDNKSIIDQETLNRCKNRVEMLKNNKDIIPLFTDEVTDFEMDNLEIYNEKMLNCDLIKYKFGLKGAIDRYVINHELKTIDIIDLKTSSKTITDFAETVNFYNYSLQAAIYIILVGKNVSEKIASSYKISFKFVVIDKYDQTYVFEVSSNTLNEWTNNLHKTLEIINFHYIECKYNLPYQFLNNKVIL